MGQVKIQIFLEEKNAQNPTEVSGFFEVYLFIFITHYHSLSSSPFLSLPQKIIKHLVFKTTNKLNIGEDIIHWKQCSLMEIAKQP